MKKISFKKLAGKKKTKNNGIFLRLLEKQSVFLKKSFKYLILNPVTYLISFPKKVLQKLKKTKKNTTSFFSNIHNKIKKNKFLLNPYFTRIVVILFFLGINIQLLPFFLQTTRVKLPDEILVALDDAGVINKDDYIFEYIPKGIKYEEPSLDPQLIFEKLNDERDKRKKEQFIYSDRLASAAAELLNEAEKYDFELEDNPFTNEFKTALDNAEYNYEHVSHNMVVGPLKENAVIDAWFSSEQQLVALFDDDFEEVGFATKVIKTKHNETLGVTVQVLGKELPQNPEVNVQITSPVEIDPTNNFPPISNEEVFNALNDYRKTHKRSKLRLNDDLCEYAEKRIGDLIALGGLDNHEGFKKDFEDQENLPQLIKDYNGKKVAENLAFQHCRNMTTGEGFVAETGTAIIEWCFDSSTEGHREAQLSREFEHACVRSGEGMFVVIFGTR